MAYEWNGERVLAGTFADVGFQTATYSTSSGATDVRINVAHRILAIFDMQFESGTSGLVARAAPPVGIEYGF